MTDEPVDLDQRRGMAAQKATELRRQQLENFQAQQAALSRRQRELETLLQSEPAASWPEAAAKAQYLIQLLADAPEGQDPRRQSLIAQTLEDLDRLCKQAEQSGDV